MPHSKSVPPVPVHAQVQTPNNHPVLADFHSPAKAKTDPTPTVHRTRQSHLSSSVSRDRTWRGTSCTVTHLFWMIFDDYDNSNNRKKISLGACSRHRYFPLLRVTTMVPASMRRMPPFVLKVGQQPVFWSFVSSSRSPSGPSSLRPWIRSWMNCCRFFLGL